MTGFAGIATCGNLSSTGAHLTYTHAMLGSTLRCRALWRRANELRLLNRSYSLPSAQSTHHADQTLADPASLKQLHAGLQYEAANGLCDIQGRTQRFSEFAAQHFSALQQSSKTPEDIVAFHGLASGFQKYPRLKPEDRKSLLIRASHAVRGPFLRFPVPPSAVGEQQDADRRSSNGSASTTDLEEPHKSAEGLLKRKTRVKRQASTDGPDLSQVVREDINAERPTNNGVMELDHQSKNRMSHLNGQPREATTTAENNDLDQSLAAKGADRTLEASSNEEEVSSTLERHSTFYAAAKTHSKVLQELQTLQSETLGGEQRTAAWHALRDTRLTASAFSNALGFWNDGRNTLWEEKLGLRAKFAGNDATRWGSSREDEALQRYRQVTGHEVHMRSFSILGDDLVTSWLGASPDGLVDAVISSPGRFQAPIAHKRPPKGSGPGVLEIKCPFNKGEPLKASAHSTAPYYYMPQVQGLMEIFDREWCNLFSYTVNSAALFHVRRDRTYWRQTYQVLSDFWWCHIVPAKHLIARGDSEGALEYRPEEQHDLTAVLKDRSMDMAAQADAIVFPAPYR